MSELAHDSVCPSRALYPTVPLTTGSVRTVANCICSLDAEMPELRVEGVLTRVCALLCMCRALYLYKYDTSRCDYSCTMDMCVRSTTYCTRVQYNSTLSHLSGLSGFRIRFQRFQVGFSIVKGLTTHPNCRSVVLAHSSHSCYRQTSNPNPAADL